MAENQTQQRDQDVVTYEAFKGLRNDVSAERFGPADLDLAVNVDLDRSGRLSRRDGYTRVRAAGAGGPVHSLWADAEQQTCLFAQGSQLMRLAADYSAMPVATLVGVGYPLSYVRVSERIYFSNGVDTGVLENGAARSWGLPVPPLPAVAVTVGDLGAGTYQFLLTWLRGDGQESGAPLSSLVTVPDGSGLTFSWLPPTDPDIVTAALYLSAPDGELLYQAARVPAQAGTTTFTDGSNARSLPLVTQFLGPAPAGQLLAWYRGQLFVAVDDTLYVSEGFGYELFDLRKYIPLDGRITLLAPMTDKEISERSRSSGFFIGTDRSCGVLVGDDPANFQYVPKTEYGAIAGALDYVDGSLFGDDSAGARPLPVWLTTQGLCAGMPDLQIRNLTRTRYGFPVAGQGAALFVPGPNRFIASANL